MVLITCKVRFVMEGFNDTHVHAVAPVTNTSREPQQHIYDVAIDFVGGISGGTASVYIGQSLDTVKVKLQTFPGMYSSAWDCFKQTFKQEGLVRGLYAGTVPSLVAQASENAMLFMAYGVCQKMVLAVSSKTEIKQLSPVQNATAGGLAAFWSSLALCPTELIKCKMQAMEQLKSSGEIKTQDVRGPWSLTKQIVQEQGLRGLFRGLSATLVREMPGYFFFFGGYEGSRYLLTPSDKTKDDIGAVRTMACGAAGGVCFWLSIFPADVIKSRVQVHTSEIGHTPGFFRMLIDVTRYEGITALYKGLGPTLLRTIPATGGLFLAYETTKSFLQNRVQRSGDNL